jgi:transposase-like protein
VARLVARVLNLNDCERDELQQVLKRHNTPQQIALRVKIVLLASEGKNHREIARTLGIAVDMARLWRNRWLSTCDGGDQQRRKFLFPTLLCAMHHYLKKEERVPHFRDEQVYRKP